MRKISVVFWLGLLMAFGKVVSAQVFAPTDGRKIEEPKEYFQGDLTDFQVSPSGKGVAYLKYDNGRWVLYWDNINGGRETRVSKSQEASVVDYRWVGDDALVYSVGEGEIGTELHRYETFTKAYNRLTSTPVWIKFLDSHQYSSGTTLLIRSVDDVTSTKAYSILPGTRELKHIATGHGVNWVGGIGNGATFCIEKTEEGCRFLNCTLNGGEKLGTVRGLCSLKGLALASKADASIYALSDLNRNCNALVKMNMRDGSETEVLFETKQCMITKVLFSSASIPLVVWYEGIEQGFQALDNGFEETLAAITEKMPTLFGFDIVHSDLSGNVWIVSAINPGGGRVYYHYNVANRELKPFGNAKIGRQIAPVSELFPAGDDNLLVRVYLPEEVNSKSQGVLVFRDAPWWPTQPGGLDALIQRLVQEGMIVADIDLGYSELSRKKMLFSGYDQLVERMIKQVPLIQNALMSSYGLPQGMLSVIGEGIGCRAALRVTAVHTSIVLRSVFIDAAPELEGYLKTQFPIEIETRDYIMGYGKSTQGLEIPYIAREPLFVYGTVKGAYYSSNIEPALKKLTQAGKAPESIMVGSGFGSHISSGVVKGIGDKLVYYLKR
jgi:hypothetical protein